MKVNLKIKISLILLIMTTNSCSVDVPNLLSSVIKSIPATNTNKTKDDAIINPSASPSKSPDAPINVDNEAVNIQQVRFNITTFKDMIEKYSNKKNGYYPETVSDLYTDALVNNYWKDFNNPYTSRSGIGIDGSFVNMVDYKYYTTQSSLKGLVVYEPLKCTDTKDICSYKLYGTDKNGALLQ